MHKPESESDTHKILWDFEIKTILARRPNLVIAKTNNLVDFAVQRITVKIKEKSDKYLDHARVLKMQWTWE